MNNNHEHSQKEQWKDEILSSVEGIQRPEAPPFLFTRITARLRTTSESRVSAPMLAFGVAAFVVLCCVNVWILADFTIASTPNTTEQPLQTASTLETVSFDLD
jgi:hypothetical protein